MGGHHLRVLSDHERLMQAQKKIAEQEAIIHDLRLRIVGIGENRTLMRIANIAMRQDNHEILDVLRGIGERYEQVTEEVFYDE